MRLANILAGEFFLTYFTFENVLEIFLVLVEVLLGDKRTLTVTALMEFLVHELVDNKCFRAVEIFLTYCAFENSAFP